MIIITILILKILNVNNNNKNINKKYKKIYIKSSSLFLDGQKLGLNSIKAISKQFHNFV